MKTHLLFYLAVLGLVLPQAQAMSKDQFIGECTKEMKKSFKECQCLADRFDGDQRESVARPLSAHEVEENPTLMKILASCAPTLIPIIEAAPPAPKNPSYLDVFRVTWVGKQIQVKHKALFGGKYEVKSCLQFQNDPDACLVKHSTGATLKGTCTLSVRDSEENSVFLVLKSSGAAEWSVGVTPIDPLRGYEQDIMDASKEIELAIRAQGYCPF